MTTAADLDFYRQPAKMTSPGPHAALLDALPRDLAALVAAEQGLLLHQHWAAAYGVTLSDEQQRQPHTRPLSGMLDVLLSQDGRPLTAARSLETRFVGNCRHFTVFLVAALRAQGVPARARCGFGAYFSPIYEDHWVCEYWRASDERWVLVDAQIDAKQRSVLNIDFDLLDVPRTRFLIAGDAWQQCRRGILDAAHFGIFDMRGFWFIAGNVLRDFAALNNVEMLPWDCWGAMPGAGDTIGLEEMALFDRLAALTLDPDANRAELQRLYQCDDSLRVPPTVFNAVLQRPDSVEA